MPNDSHSPKTVGRHSFVAFFVGSSLIGICLLVASVGIAKFFDPVDWPMFVFFSPVTIFSLWAAFYTLAKLLNRKSSEVSSEHLKSRQKRIQIVGMIFLAGGLCLLVWLFASSFPPVSGTHQTFNQLRFGGVPSNGTDYCFRRLGRGSVCCDFAISEENFRKWIESESRWNPCQQIGESDSQAVWNCLKNEEINITDGLQTFFGREARGGKAVFDRKANRAYYWTFY